MKHECKITVLETKCFPDLQEKYLADPKSGPCPFFKPGDTFLLKRTPQQDDFYHLMNGKFCGEAWDAVSRYVYTALQGGSIMKGWTNDDRMMITCCNDGTRPVIFKIERIDIPENDEEREWLAKQNFRNTAEDAYTGELQENGTMEPNFPNREKLINVLERVSVLNRDDGHRFTNTDRLDAIASLLSSSSYKRVETQGLFHLYSKKPVDEISGPVIIVSSHVDCERNITKCFTSFKDDDTLLGTFDNAITNAAITYSMLSGDLPENVLIAFTGDEEENSRGAYDLIRFIKKHHLDILNILVLETTEEGWMNGADFTIENDFWDETVGKKIIELAKQTAYKWNYVPGEPDYIPDYIPREVIIPIEACSDESWDYDEEDISCFSLCLPTKGDMHSNRGILARINSFERYTDMLQIILHGLSAMSV